MAPESSLSASNRRQLLDTQHTLKSASKSLGPVSAKGGRRPVEVSPRPIHIVLRHVPVEGANQVEKFFSFFGT